MPSAKPTQPPTFDSKGFVQRIREHITKPDGSYYTVFGDQYFPKFMRWVRSESEYDGTGLRDVVNANAYYLDAVKGDLDGFKDSAGDQLQDLQTRVAALETQPSLPFPASSSIGG